MAITYVARQQQVLDPTQGPGRYKWQTVQVAEQADEAATSAPPAAPASDEVRTLFRAMADALAPFGPDSAENRTRAGVRAAAGSGRLLNGEA